MTNNQILLYLNQISFLGFNSWLCYPAYPTGFCFIPAEKTERLNRQDFDYTLPRIVAEGIANLILSNIIKVDELEQQIELYRFRIEGLEK